MEKKSSKESQASRQKIKIVLLGDKGVGKSSIINKFALNKFDENVQATIGVDFLTKTCKFNNSRYKLELWDTAGQEKYRSLIKGYLRGAFACVFVYDESNPATYRNLVEWVKAFEEVSKNDQTFTLLFGNKTDIAVEKNELLKIKQEVQKQYPKMAEMTQFQGSAKLGQNIYQIFEQILENFQKLEGSLKIPDTKTMGQTLVETFRAKSMANSWNCCHL